jgi:hypothetical protein
MEAFQSKRIGELLPASGDMGDKRTFLQIPDPKEESERKAFRLS